MNLRRTCQYLFVLYCTTVGVALVLLPWSPGWDRLVGALPFSFLIFLLKPTARGALTGFGMLHLVLGLYELRDFLIYQFSHEPTDPKTDGDR